ncbi:hypothetical protein CEF21_18470 [Bacillus sp. FJAT-42376]|uniref:hypothetical protein n=1 Tax=Bacillus sp. FJAT-42376 TaxID=2014076 RepID=UPI000F4EB46A|nr:hypothetical protein [Bacillus sp. FJAT-42376]AZB44119.1 hypothetical protein CEF21_18470 [Bacillus sp. FJAT-42376]
MMAAYYFMLGSMLLSVFHFLYSYKEAIRVSNEEGPVFGWGLVFNVPLAFLFAILANLFYQQL